MAEELRLWAINVEAFRRCFAAPEPLAERLRELAAPLVAAASPRRPRTLLSRLGPLTRRPPAGGVIRPGVPNLHDVEALLSGRFIDSTRADACWALVRAWLDGLSQDRIVIPLARDRIDAVEFDLVRSDVPTELSIRHLWLARLEIPLRSSDHMSIGFTSGRRLPDLQQAWTAALPQIDDETADVVNPILSFIAPLVDPAKATDPADPDLLAWWTSR